MRELEEKEIKEIEELEKLTINVLKEEIAKIENNRYLYIQETKRKIKVIDTVIKAHELIEIYKKEGFKSVYRFIDYCKGFNDREGRYPGDDIPF